MLITHGHYYYVNTGIEDIEREAEGRGFDIVMFGHTHRPIIDYHKAVSYTHLDVYKRQKHVSPVPRKAAIVLYVPVP